jgi:hypothetical protein
VFRYRSAAHWVDFFRAYYGPTHKAFAALDAPRQEALRASLVEFLQAQNTGRNGTLAIPGEYLEAVITKHGVGRSQN